MAWFFQLIICCRLFFMEKLCTVSENKTRSWLGSDYELLIIKFRLKLKNIGKITRPFRYDLNHIPYNYTVERRNRFKGLNLIECLKNYGWRLVTLYRRQWSKTPPRKTSAKKGKWLSEEALQIAEKRREEKEKENRKDIPIKCTVPKNSKER